MHSSLALPPLDAITAMLAAARLGSFTAAAIELGVTHGSVSRRIQVVEAWLGVSVFERHGRGVRLSPTGAHFARHAETALNRLAEVAHELRAARQTERVRLSVLPSFARLWLMPRLAAVQGEHADLVIQLLAEHRLANLERGEADIAIRFGLGAWPGVDAQRLLGERWFALASPTIAQALRGREPAEVLRQTLLHDTDATHWRSWCRHAGVPWRPRGGERRFEDYDLVLAAAESGVGVAIARWPLAAALLKSGRLVRIGGPLVESSDAHFVVTRSGEVRSGVLRARERLLKQAAASAKERLPRVR